MAALETPKSAVLQKLKLKNWLATGSQFFFFISTNK